MFAGMRVLSLLCLLFVSLPAAAAEWSATLGYTSDYTVLGLSRSRGEGAVQGGLTVETTRGWYASLWASQVEYAYTPAGQYDPYRDKRDLELDGYVGYGQELTAGWRLEGVLARYTYPGASATRDWDYSELLAALHYRDRLSLALGINRNLFGQNRLTRTLDADVRLFAWQGWLASAGAGYVDSAALETGYWHGRLGVSRRFSAWRFGLVWHTTDDTAREIFGPARAGSRLEARLDVGF